MREETKKRSNRENNSKLPAVRRSPSRCEYNTAEHESAIYGTFIRDLRFVVCGVCVCVLFVHVHDS